MTEKTFTIVGVSTQGKITKFRVANGEIADRVKILERAGCTDINFIQLPQAMTKMDAIEAYKSQSPESASIRMPNTKETSAKSTKPRTVTVKKGKGSSVDAANELLKAIEQA